MAANEELGKDLEHVEVLQKRFSDFVHSVLAAEDRVLHVSTLADTLLEAKHTGKVVDSVTFLNRKTMSHLHMHRYLHHHVANRQ